MRNRPVIGSFKPKKVIGKRADEKLVDYGDVEDIEWVDDMHLESVLELR